MKNELVPTVSLKYVINYTGCVQSKRATKKDGVIYFGPRITSGLNDIELDIESNPDEVSHFFKIYYAKEENNYYLKDMGEGLGTFVRVDSRTVLKQGNVITFGQQHLVVNYKLCKELDPDQPIIIQLIQGQKLAQQ